MNKLLTLAAFAAVASTATASITLNLDFGSAGTGSLLGPGHVSNGGVLPDEQNVWNNIFGPDNGNVADVASGILDATGAATGVSINFGVGSLVSIDYDSQPFARTGVSGARSGTGVFNNTTFRDFIGATNSNSTPTTVGMAISGLDAGNYKVFVAARNTNVNSDATASDTYDIFVGAGDLLTAPNTLGTASIQQYSRANPLANTGSWAIGEGFTWVSLDVTLAAGESLLIFSESEFENQHGIINAVQVVPEPSTYAAILGAMALAFVAYRRRRR